MAQQTSNLWKTLWRMKETVLEHKFDIAGTVYGPDVEVTHSVDSSLYEKFARIMGVEMDLRTQLNQTYTIDYPASDPESGTGGYYSIRQELQWIAAAHCGNWIITGEGKLFLVPLMSMPEETSYLVTEYGDAITLGGVKLLV